MAHLITIRENGFAETAFVGDTPWHGLGQHIEQDATIEMWAQMAGMDWTVERTAVEFSGVNGLQTFGGQNVLYRSDTGAPLSVVSDRYHAVQPRGVLEFFRRLVDIGGFQIRVAGTLQGGKRLWALAETGRYADVAKDDAVGAYLLLSTSCDRSLATTARFTSVRVVCNNTLNQAVRGGQGVVSFTHMSKFDPEALQSKLMGAVETFGSFIEMAQHLQRQQMGAKAAEEFLATLIGSVTQVKTPGYDVTNNRSYAKILSLFDGQAKGAHLIGHTRWGMLNAVTEYWDHHAPSRSVEARIDSAWFGRGNGVKNNALAILTA